MFSKIALMLLSLALLLSGCGDLKGGKVVKRKLEGSQFQVDCKLDMKKFSNIMTEPIGDQIRCLGENLNLFIRIAKNPKTGYLSRVQLKEYLANFRPDVTPEVVQALDSVFLIGHLITGEDPEYISKEVVDKVINFALVFNEEASLYFQPTFQNKSPASWTLHQKHRQDVSDASKAIVQSLRQIFNPDRKGQIHKLNIIDLLTSFSTESNKHEIEKVKKVLFAKGVLLGGQNDVITHVELERLILNFDRLILIGLDIVRYQYIDLNQEDILQLLKRDVNDLYDIVTQGVLNNRDGEILFTVDEAIEAVKLFVEKEDFDIDQYQNLIREAKKIAMKGNSNDVKGIELKNLFNHAKSLLQSGTIFHRIYDKFKVQLNSSGPVNINFSEYLHTYPGDQAELNQFERIVNPKKYRFMKGEFLSPYYTREFHRNPDAIFEIAMFEYILKLVFATYGSPSPNADAVGGFSINQEQMRKLVLTFENELIDLGILLPQKAVGTADNISLLGTLFQYQSDKNKVMDVNEGTEFALTLFTSMDVASELFDYMKAQGCDVQEFQNKDNNRIEPVCFKKNYWKGLCKYYRDYYPLLFSWMSAPAKCEDFAPTQQSAEFLSRTMEAALTCTHYPDGAKEEIYITEGDIMTITIALLHIEATILRWDKNNNNIMDSNEVMDAYEIYSPALDGFLDGITKKFKKQIFQFMIKYEKVPDTKDFGSIWKFIKFLVSFNKKAPATRKTIASILVAIGNENKKTQTGPQFDCKWLRDPDNIPRDPNTLYPAVDTRQDFSSLLSPYLHLAK